MPTFFRVDCETTRIDRVSSYSVGKARVEERHDDLFGPRGERHAEEDLLRRLACRDPRSGPLGLDPEPLLGLSGGVSRTGFGLDQVEPDPVAAERGVFAEQVEQVGPGLDELARDLGAVIRLDVDRSIGLGICGDQLAGLIGERVRGPRRSSRSASRRGRPWRRSRSGRRPGQTTRTSACAASPPLRSPPAQWRRPIRIMFR